MTTEQTANTLHEMQEICLKYQQENERLRQYVGSEMLMSDFQTAGDMRQELAHLREQLTDVQHTAKILTDDNRRYSEEVTRLRQLLTEAREGLGWLSDMMSGLLPMLCPDSYAEECEEARDKARALLTRLEAERP